MLKEGSNEIIISSPLTEGGETIKVDARALSYRELNAKVRGLVCNGARRIELHNVYGQRYIGTGLDKPVEIEIFGTPGNDLGAFMDGPKIVVHGNAQDGCGNTMNSGEIVIHGHAGDILGLSARGGKILVRDDVGYRAAIHMKEYLDKKPVVVIGGTAQDFVGEYMAGGIVVLLGLNLKEGEHHRANFIGTGMHGGAIYIRGEVQKFQLGKEVAVAELDRNDYLLLKELIAEFAHHFGYNAEEILSHKFIKLFPLHLRPYGRLYAY
jgi:glutamate synthase domain-containing protein 3